MHVLISQCDYYVSARCILSVWQLDVSALSFHLSHVLISVTTWMAVHVWWNILFLESLAQLSHPSYLEPFHLRVMVLVPFLAPRPLHELLLPVLLADRHLQCAHAAVDELYHIQDFLEDIHEPRALQHVTLSIRHLQRTIVCLEIYKLEQMAVFRRALYLHFQFFGHALHWHWWQFHPFLWTGLTLPLVSTCRNPRVLKNGERACCLSLWLVVAASCGKY